MAMSQEHGNNLQTVQLLLKKNQVDKSYPALNSNHTLNSVSLCFSFYRYNLY